MKQRIYGILIAVLAAVGRFSGYMYYKDVTLPAKQLDEAAEEQDAVFEEIRQSFSQPQNRFKSQRKQNQRQRGMVGVLEEESET